MSANQASFGVAITADDKTAKGVRSASKRLGTVSDNAARANRIAADSSERSWRRSGVGIVRTFGQVERASARAFGNSSLTSGLTGRLGAVREAASAAGTGLGEAATAGGLLSGTLTAVGVAAGATVGVLAAAGYAAFKLVDGWAKGAATLGRMADTIGVAKKELQEFTAAAERAGVDKGAAAGTLGSLSQTLNDARYGRNRDAVGVLEKLGVGMKLNADGTVNVGAMLPAIADAIARQNSSGRRTAARALGISTEALPAFTQGGAALTADMRDADRTAYIASDADIARAQRITRKGVRVGQLKDRALGAAGSAAADLAEPGYDAVLRTGTNLVAGSTNFGAVVSRSFRPGAEAVERGGRAIERAAAGAGAVVTRGAISLSREVIGAARASQAKYGVPASISLGQYGLESGFGRHMPRGSNNPFGIKARKGEPYVIARTREEDAQGRSYYINERFRKFGSIGEAFDAHARLLANGKAYARARSATSVEGYADALTGTYATDHRYGASLKSVIRKNGLTDFDQGPPAPIPLKIEIDMRGAPAGTKVKASAGHQVAISHSPVGAAAH